MSPVRRRTSTHLGDVKNVGDLMSVKEMNITKAVSASQGRLVQMHGGQAHKKGKGDCV